MKLHPGEIETLLREKLGPLAERVTDADLGLLVSLCRHVDGAWSALGAAAQSRLRIFIERTDAMGALAEAWDTPGLSDVVTGRVAQVDDEALVALAIVSRRAECLEEIVQRFEKSRSYKQMSALRESLGEDHLRPLWSVPLKRRLVVSLSANARVREYMGYVGAVERVLKLSTNAIEELRSEWRPVYDGLTNRSVAEKVRAVYPDFPPPPAPAPASVQPDPDPDSPF